jgi:hypothetical protein
MGPKNCLNFVENTSSQSSGKAETWYKRSGVKVCSSVDKCKGVGVTYCLSLHGRRMSRVGKRVKGTENAGQGPRRMLSLPFLSVAGWSKLLRRVDWDQFFPTEPSNYVSLPILLQDRHSVTFRRNMMNLCQKYKKYVRTKIVSTEIVNYEQLTHCNYLINTLYKVITIYPSVCLSVCLSFLPSFRSSIHPSIYLSVYLSIYLSICLSISLSLLFLLLPLGAQGTRESLPFTPVS